MANNLKDHLKEVADAIRAKKGTTDLINPQDFATEIEGLTSGSGESGGSNIEYLDVSSIDSQMRLLLFTGAYTAKGIVSDNVWIVAPYIFLYQGVGDNIQFVAVDMNQNIALGSGMVTLKKALIDDAGYTQEQLDAIPRITKEQFYDSNA